MKLLYETRCCRHKLHGVYVQETCFKRFLEFNEAVSLLFFLKLVSYFSRLLANYSSAFPEGQFTCNSCKCVYKIKKRVFHLARYNMDDNDFPSKDIEKLIELWQQEECLWTISLDGTTISSSSVSNMLTKALCIYA